MKDLLAPHKRIQSYREELANSVSHAVAVVACIVAAPFLIAIASRSGGTSAVVGSSIFLGSALIMYLSSTLYHLLPKHRAKDVFRMMDHGAIFILIAGTYTPFTLGVLRGTLGWTLLGIIWGLAVLGLALKILGVMRHPFLSSGLYLAMGWLIVIAIRPLWMNMPFTGFAWLVAGGLAYTVGVVFYAVEKLPYSHFIWHLFVMAGTTCHFLAVLHAA